MQLYSQSKRFVLHAVMACLSAAVRVRLLQSTWARSSVHPSCFLSQAIALRSTHLRGDNVESRAAEAFRSKAAEPEGLLLCGLLTVKSRVKLS